MNILCTSRMIIIALFLLGLTGCGGGGGGDGESGRPSAPPEYDLTGVWEVTTPVGCVAVSSAFSEYELSNFASVLEADLLLGLGTRLVQMGNELEITNLSTGFRGSGTISGDQVHFPYSEQAMLGEFEVDSYGAYAGTVLNANRIAMRLEGTVNLEANGEMATLGVLCSLHFTRTS